MLGDGWWLILVAPAISDAVPVVTRHFSLKAVCQQLTATSAKTLIARYLTCWSIQRDLHDAAELLRIHKAHRLEQIAPTGRNNSHGDQGYVARALFQSFAAHLCRAVDPNSRGRVRLKELDFAAIFADAGLTENATELRTYRDKELGHFDAYAFENRTYSAGDAILTVRDGGMTFLDDVFSGTNTKLSLIAKFEPLLPCSQSAIALYIEQVEADLLHLIETDWEVKAEFEALLPQCKFDPATFFVKPMELRDYPTGVFRMIKWNLP